MELTNEQKNYVITFETAVQRLVMNMPNIHRDSRMDVVRYITEWLLRRPQFFTSHTPLHLARAVTRTRTIDYIRQQARQSAERTWNDIDKCFVGNVALDEMMIQISASDASTYEEALNPESIFFTKASREIIDQALIKHLTKKQYDVFTLRAFNDFNVNEIASLTRSKHYNVSRLYSQAQKRLRKVYVANPEELGL
jgi:RNA polymerase sigma factor (sigma-70 family)